MYPGRSLKMSLVCLVVGILLWALPGVVLAESTLTAGPGIGVIECNNARIWFSVTIDVNLETGDLFNVTEYLNGAVLRTYTGDSGPRDFTYTSYSLWVIESLSSPPVPYPYDVVAHLDLVSGGEVLTRYEITGSCTALNTGTASIRQLIPEPGDDNPGGGPPGGGVPGDRVPDNPGNAGGGTSNGNACADNPGRANDHRPDNVPPCRG